MYERNKVCRALKARSVALRQRAQRSVFVTLDRKLIGSGGGGVGGGGVVKKICIRAREINLEKN